MGVRLCLGRTYGGFFEHRFLQSMSLMCNYRLAEGKVHVLACDENGIWLFVGERDRLTLRHSLTVLLGAPR
jgi:hypothetical protein